MRPFQIFLSAPPPPLHISSSLCIFPCSSPGAFLGCREARSRCAEVPPGSHAASLSCSFEYGIVAAAHHRRRRPWPMPPPSPASSTSSPTLFIDRALSHRKTLETLPHCRRHIFVAATFCRCQLPVAPPVAASPCPRVDLPAVCRRKLLRRLSFVCIDHRCFSTPDLSVCAAERGI